MMIMCMGAYGGNTRDIKVKIAIDQSFRKEYIMVPNSYAENFFNDAKGPFLSKWGLNIIGYFTNFDGLIFPDGEESLWIRNCPYEYDESCEGRCGNICNNSILSTGHHKNAFKYFEQLKKYQIEPGIHDIILTLSSYSTCWMNDGIHDYGPWGLANTNGEYAWVYAANNMGGWDYAQQQNIQHELSHIFGAGHCQSKSWAPCIMSGGFNGEDTSKKSDIWCSICENEFNRDRVF